MENENFGVLICIDIVFVDKETMDLSQHVPKIPFAVPACKVFFVVPESKKRIVFLNSELTFTYGVDNSLYNSLLLPFDIIFLDTINIRKIFRNITFSKYRRDEYYYITENIRRKYIPYSEPAFTSSDSKFEI
jgi:hypothetical protein